MALMVIQPSAERMACYFMTHEDNNLY